MKIEIVISSGDKRKYFLFEKYDKKGTRLCMTDLLSTQN